MADISKCNNHKCKKAQGCWRYHAPVNQIWQSYADFQPDKEGKCEHYWPFEASRIAAVSFDAGEDTSVEPARTP